MRLLGVVLISSLWGASAHARDLTLIYKNNRAVQMFKREKRQESFDQFLGLTAKSSSDAQIQFNMATSLHALGEEEKAVKLYLPLLKNVETCLEKAHAQGEGSSAPKECGDLEVKHAINLRFALLYNLGVAYQFMQNNDEALRYYQQALEMSPDNKEIKVNIEMMFAGGGGGKGKNKDKSQQQKGEGDGEGDPEDQDQDQDQDKKDQDQQKDEKEQKDQKPQQKKPKEFDQKYMSKEDLQRIMEELNGQEQKIRAKMERKGGKSAPKDKEW